MIRALVEAQRQLLDALERSLPPTPEEPRFVPTDMQQRILAALNGRSLRTDALAAKVNVNRRTLFKDPGGLGELVEEGLVAHHKRVGYWHPDAPPPDLPPELQAE